MSAAEKTCASCGRRIEWRAKWAENWDEVRYCSTACRRRGVRPVDRRLEELIAARLARSGSMDDVADAAREAAVEEGVAEADLAEPARRAARRLVAAGRAEIVQRGRVVDPSTAKGPFGIRRPR